MNGIYSRTAGLTFLEIMLAMAILSLLGSVGVNNWHEYQQRLKLDIVSAQLMTFLSRVQSQANWSNANYQLRTGQNASTVELTVINESDRQPVPGLKFISTEKSVSLKNSELISPAAFYGQRNMASSGHFIVGNGQQEVKVIISARGRIRRCVERQPNSTQTVMGIALC